VSRRSFSTQYAHDRPSRPLPRSRSTSEIRSVSSAFCPKLSPRSSPRIRMNSSGIPSSTPAATRSRSSSRSSFFASTHTSMATPPGRGPAPRGPPRQVQEDPLEVGLLGLQLLEVHLRLAQQPHQPQQRPLDVAALQFQPTPVALEEPAVRQRL